MRQVIWLVTITLSGLLFAQAVAHAHQFQALAKVNVDQSIIEDGRNGSISLRLEL